MKYQVADIFTAAGAAFNRLGELTVQLHPLTSDGSAQTRWVKKTVLISLYVTKIDCRLAYDSQVKCDHNLNHSSTLDSGFLFLVCFDSSSCVYSQIIIDRLYCI